MTEHEASRTLVKSAPELWAECSDAASLARHLDQFGEIRITKLEPETAVAWEGERVSGTVRLEPSGWGTRVTLTANAGAGGPAGVGAPAVDSAAAVEAPAEVDTPAAVDSLRAVDTPAAVGSTHAAIPDPPPDPDPDPDPDPVPDPDPDPAPLPPPAATAMDDLALDQPARGGLFMRLRRAMGGGSRPVPTEQPVAVAVPPQPPSAEPLQPPSAEPLQPPSAEPLQPPSAEPPRPSSDEPLAQPTTAEPAATAPAEEPSVLDPAAEHPLAEGRPAEHQAAERPAVEHQAAEHQPTSSEPAVPPLDASAVLTSALDSLGQAHHRPFSRA